MTQTESIENKAYKAMWEKVEKLSDESLKAIWEAICSLHFPQDDYSIFVEGQFCHIPFEDWAVAIDIEIGRRNIKALRSTSKEYIK